MLKKEKLKVIRKWHPNTTIDNFRLFESNLAAN